MAQNRTVSLTNGQLHKFMENVYGGHKVLICTVMIISFRTNRSEKTVQTLIRLLLEDQSDQGLHCLLLHLQTLLCYNANFLEFLGDYTNILGVRKFRTFMVSSDLGLEFKVLLA